MKLTLSSVLSYITGVLLIVAGAIGTLVSPLGLISVLTGFLTVPAMRRKITARTGVELSRGLTVAVAIVGAIVVIAAFASAGGGETSGPGSQVSNVSASAVDADPSDPTQSLQVRYNTRAQRAVDPNQDDMTNYQSESGQKYLVVRMEIRNTGDENIDLTPRLFRFQNDGVEYEYQGLFGASQGGLQQVSLQPDATYSGWVVFSIPEETRQGEVIVYQDAYIQSQTAVSFERDSSLPIDLGI